MTGLMAELMPTAFDSCPIIFVISSTSSGSHVHPTLICAGKRVPPIAGYPHRFSDCNAAGIPSRVCSMKYFCILFVSSAIFTGSASPVREYWVKRPCPFGYFFFNSSSKSSPAIKISLARSPHNCAAFSSNVIRESKSSTLSSTVYPASLYISIPFLLLSFFQLFPKCIKHFLLIGLHARLIERIHSHQFTGKVTCKLEKIK